MSYTRSKIVEQAKSWLGRKESDGSHKEIIDVYNAHRPLARGYKVKYTDAWCATFVSACAIKCGYTEIIPTECGCQKMIALLKGKNSWVENDAYVPKYGDIIFYDWDDSGKGDDTGHSDHVGIVENVNGDYITVIEGNYRNSVKRRNIKVNAKTIRGYGVPKYDADRDETPAPAPSKPAEPTAPVEDEQSTKKITATDSARSKDSSVAGTYKTTAYLNMRNGAGKSKKVMVIVPKNTKVRNYGFYTELSGTKWLYVRVTLNGIVYTGFCSAKYLDKV